MYVTEIELHTSMYKHGSKSPASHLTLIYDKTLGTYFYDCTLGIDLTETLDQVLTSD